MQVNHNHGMAEEEMIAGLYSKLCTSNSVAFDIGANKGFHTKRLLGICKQGLVYAVEANPSHFPGLVSLAHHNKCLVVIPKAVTPRDFDTRTVAFKVSEEFHGRGGLSGIHIWERIDPAIQFKEVQVACIHFDKLLEQSASPPTFIKMDIEGPEYACIYYSDYLRKCEDSKKPCIALENSVHGLDLAGTTFIDFYAFLKEFKYSLLDRKGGVITTEDKRRSSGQTAFVIPDARLAEAASILAQQSTSS